MLNSRYSLIKIAVPGGRRRKRKTKSMAIPPAAPSRVLQIISSMNPDFGGPQEATAQIARSLQALAIPSDIATLDDPRASWGGERVIRLGPGRLGQYCYSERLIPWLRSNARHYTAVVIHGLWQYHGFAAWRALAGTGVPYYVFTHGMLDPWFKRQYPLKHLKKQLYWPWAEYRVLRDAQAVLFTTEEERQLARSSFDRYRVNEAVVGFGIADPQAGDRAELRASFLRRYPQLQGKRIVLFLGRLHPKKGCDLLIDAFAAIAHREPTLQLVMAGPGQEALRAELLQQAQRLGIADRICWTGMIQGETKWGAYHSAEVFALPSHQENFGISVAEAIACRVPVLISNKVNIWREIAAERCGLVADDTPAGTQQLLEKWLDLSTIERERMGANGLACFRKHFHIDATTARLAAALGAHSCNPPTSSAA
jgi:glycosyltransferase involved in cell wall biosynthesis